MKSVLVECELIIIYCNFLTNTQTLVHFGPTECLTATCWLSNEQQLKMDQSCIDFECKCTQIVLLERTCIPILGLF